MIRTLITLISLLQACGGSSDSDRLPAVSDDSSSGGDTSDWGYPDSAADTMELVQSEGGNFYIDRFEASLIGAYAVSVQSRKPRTSFNYEEARDACEKGSKRLCTLTEWRAACKGPNSNDYGVSATSDGLDELCVLGDIQDTTPDVKATGDNESCFTEGTTIYDMVGNAAEWVNNTGATVAGSHAGTTADAAICDFTMSYLDEDDDGRIDDYIAADTESDIIAFRCCVDEASFADVPSPASIYENYEE